jgi:hypothetical protein
MQAFGITINKNTLPLIYLACSIVGFLLMRESIVMFQHPIATRAISIILELGFIALSIPAIYQLKTIKLPVKAIILTLLWLTWTLASTLLGEQPWAAMMRWFEILTCITTAFVLCTLINQRPDFIELIVKAIAAALLLCILAFATFWFVSPSPVQHDWSSDIPLFMNIRHFGYLVASALPLGYWLLEKKVLTNKSKLSSLVYLSLCWALVFWLGGRGTFLGVIAATFIYFIVSKEQIKWIVITIISGLALSQLFIVDHPSLNLFRILDLFWNANERDIDSVSSFRMTIYMDSLMYWWNTAPLMGIGADGFRHIMPAIAGVESIAHPHSIIVQLLISYGIIGLLIPSYFFFLLSLKVFKSNNKQTQVIYLSFLSTMVLSIFDGVLYHAYGLFISSIIAGVCIALAWPITTSTQTVSPNRTPSAGLLVLVLSLTTLLSTLYCSIFAYQLYNSKYIDNNAQWINWNARYPLYFSPTWTYQRHNTEEIEILKQRYIKKLNTNNKQQDKK